MKLREDVYKWIEAMNPLLLFNKLDILKPLKKPKKIKLFPDTEVLILDGVDHYEYIPALEKWDKGVISRK